MLKLALGMQTKTVMTMTHPLKCLKLKRLTIPNISEDVEQLEFSHVVEGNAKMTQLLGRTLWRFLINMQFINTHFFGRTENTHKNSYTQMFRAASFTIAKN